MPRMTSMVLGAGLALTLVASIACGSKKAEETPKTAATTAATSAAATAAPKTAATTAAATAAAKTGAAVGAALSPAQFKEAMCGNWKTVAAAAGPGAGMVPPAGPPTSAAAGLAQTETMVKQMVANAPAELKPDFEVFAKYLTEYSAAMTRANGDMMKLAQDPTFVKMMESGTTEVDKASKNIEAWTQKNC